MGFVRLRPKTAAMILDDGAANKQAETDAVAFGGTAMSQSSVSLA